jgi:hypothetical protein
MTAKTKTKAGSWFPLVSWERKAIGATVASHGKNDLQRWGLKYFKTFEYKMLDGEFSRSKTAAYPTSDRTAEGG